MSPRSFKKFRVEIPGASVARPNTFRQRFEAWQSWDCEKCPIMDASDWLLCTCARRWCRVAVRNQQTMALTMDLSSTPFFNFFLSPCCFDLSMSGVNVKYIHQRVGGTQLVVGSQQFEVQNQRHWSGQMYISVSCSFDLDYCIEFVDRIVFIEHMHRPLKPPERFPFGVSRCGLTVRRLAGKQKDFGSIRFGSSFSSLQKLWFMDAVLWLCPHNS